MSKASMPTDGLGHAGPWSLSSDRERRRQTERTGGAPRADFPPGETPYSTYAHMDTLLSLQHPCTDSVTEPAFIIMSQVKELLFKLLCTEFTTARDYLGHDQLDDALWTLRRSARVQQFLLSSWDVLAALTPAEFAEFRDVLGSASGFQSVSYRRLEFLLGNKSLAMAQPHRNSPAYGDMLAQLRQPSLYDETLALLRRRGFNLPRELLDRDFSLPYHTNDVVESAWREIYQEPVRCRDLYLLGEALLDTSDLFARWRYTHLVTVQRLLGDKPGTGGTHGMSWLSKISGHRFFPELWSVRSAL
jgi:tryptophan 2,3-dioxygenase